MIYNDTTYCTVDDIKKITAIVNAVNEEQIEPFILSAEEMHIYPVLGETLNAQLLSEIEQGILSGSNEQLVVNYVIPSSAWYSFYDAIPFLSTKVSNKGMTQNYSDSSTPIDLDMQKHYAQNVKDKAVFYLNRLRKHLDDNQTKFPNYRIDCEIDRRSYSTGIWLPK